MSHASQRASTSESPLDGLDLAPVARDRLALVGRPGTEPELPGDAAAAAALEWAGAAPEDVAAVLAARPEPGRHPAHWYALGLLVDELRRTADRPVPAVGFPAWPALPASAGAVGGQLYAWAVLARIDAVRELHRKRGVPEDVSRDSLGSLGRVLAEHHRVTGERGLGRFSHWSLPLRFRGADYALGRHCFTRAEVGLGDGVSGYNLHVHVPGGGGLDPDRSAASFAAARAFFPAHYPEEPIAAFTCHSWLLDPQLAEYLPPTSNILAFQRRFPLLLPHLPTADPNEVDREVLHYVFDTELDEGPITPDLLDRLPATSSLTRGFAAHLRAGRHWHKRAGWAEFGRE